MPTVMPPTDTVETLGDGELRPFASGLVGLLRSKL